MIAASEKMLELSSAITASRHSVWLDQFCVKGENSCRRSFERPMTYAAIEMYQRKAFGGLTIGLIHLASPPLMGYRKVNF